ncbi:hypothetical protein [Methylacidimicrobium sp. B4]|uniref:hypothetical protein n=1 Tax=Methylacidimicrobium sp. B4 TaxID=2796139 RepID=UPI001A8C1631|nr:hypothetical protein [Methylacidimicrobium sp. B4]QSR84211.1 hypothetical protein MacB4_08220 [Methylacidimicrobium sp. B4]
MSDLVDPDADVKPKSRPGNPAAKGYANGAPASPPAEGASGRTQRGKCPNVGECPNGGMVVEVPKGASFVCPECHSELLSERSRGARSRKKLLTLAVLVGALCLLGAVSYFALVPFVISLNGKKATEGSGTMVGSNGSPSGSQKSEPPPPAPLEKKPTLAEAEAALRKELPKGIELASLKPVEGQKNPDGSWNLTYDATIVAQNGQYWVPIADLDAANLTKRLNEVPSPERSWARRHLKDLVLTQDQAPGQEYLFSRKKPLASLTPGTPFPFAWKAVATPGEEGSWKFVPTSPLPFAAPAPSEGGADTRVVLRSSPELEQAQLLDEQRWNRFVERLKEIEREARSRYRQVMDNAPARVRRPDVFRAGSGGPTTMGEGAGIGAAGGAMGGAMFGGGEGAAIGAGVGALLGALGGGIYSHQKQQKQYEAALAERRSYERQAASAEREAREQLLSQYGQDLEEQAQRQLAQLAGGTTGAPNPSSSGGSTAGPANPPYSPYGSSPSTSGPPPMPPLPAQQPYGAPPGSTQPPDGPPPDQNPFGGASSPPPAGDGPPPPPPPPPPY